MERAMARIYHRRPTDSPMEHPMSHPNDLSRSLKCLEQDSTIVAVIQMSQSSWLVAGIVPGIERHPLKKLEPNEEDLLRLLLRWRAEATKRGSTIMRIAVAFEAGRDGFWLARWLRARDIEAYVAVMLEAVKLWPGKDGVCGTVGATAKLDSFSARRPERSADRDEETALRSNKETDEGQKMCCPAEPLDNPRQGLLGVHSRYGLQTRAVTVYRDPLSEGFSHFVSSIAAPVASGWSGCRVGLTPTGKRRLCTAHATSRHSADLFHQLARAAMQQILRSRGTRQKYISMQLIKINVDLADVERVIISKW
jgi:hypothetical protein